jgi:hypothetical protein
MKKKRGHIKAEPILGKPLEFTWTPFKYTHRKRSTMPRADAILEHWKDKMFDPPKNTETCWGCGFAGNTRAHIQGVSHGGDESLDNLALLCASCHEMQEVICSSEEGVQAFKEAIKDGAPFMKVSYVRLEAMNEVFPYYKYIK